MSIATAHPANAILSSKLKRTARTVITGTLVTFLYLGISQFLGPAPLNAQESRQNSKDSSIRVRVSLVNTPVVVRDKSGKIVTGLKPDNFRLYDNGVRQPLDAVEMGEGAPFSIAFVIETSSRIEPLLPSLHRLGTLLTDQVLGENGEAALITYSNRIETLVGLSKDRAAIQKSVGDLEVGTSDAYLYDALSEAIALLSSAPDATRRVIVTIAEAMDTGSETKLSEIVRDAQMANVTIYSIGLSTIEAEAKGPQQQTVNLKATPIGTTALAPLPGTIPTPNLDMFFREGNADVGAIVRHTWSAIVRKPLFETAIIETGGFHQSTLGYDSIEWSIEQITQELHLAYTLSFLPNQPKAGFHKVSIDVGKQPKDYKARYRSVYYRNPTQN